MSNILDGIRVLELGQVLAAPFGGAILAALGAEVIKVERVDGGDDARRMGPAFHNGDSVIFQIFNAGKKSVALDMKSSAGRAAFDQLLAGVDILVHNLRPGVPLDLGIDAATLSERHPRLIYCEISAFGHKGPMHMLPGYEPLVQAFSGLSSTNGGPGDSPIRSATSLCDQGSGMWAVIGALAMLAQRQRTGRGGVVQTSLLETALSWNAQKADAYRNEGRLPERHRSGHPGFVPYESFETQDGPLLICCGNDRLFAKLAVELGYPEWIADERYATNRARLLHKASLLPQLAVALQAQPRAQWLDRLNRAGVPCAPVHSIPEAMDHPHVQALDMFARVGGVDFSLTAMPISFNGERPSYAHAAPALGQNNVELGLAAAGTTGVTQ